MNRTNLSQMNKKKKKFKLFTKKTKANKEYNELWLRERKEIYKRFFN